MTHREVDLRTSNPQSTSINIQLATRTTKKYKQPKRNRTRNEITDDLEDRDDQPDRDFRITQGVRSQQIPPERLRYQKIYQELLKIVKSAEAASKKEEVCEYT